MRPEVPAAGRIPVAYGEVPASAQLRDEAARFHGIAPEPIANGHACHPCGSDEHGRPLLLGFDWPRPGLMGGGDVGSHPPWRDSGDHTALALHRNPGQHRGYFGEYLFDVPASNSLAVLDNRGQPLPGAAVAIFQTAGGVVQSINRIASQRLSEALFGGQQGGSGGLLGGIIAKLFGSLFGGSSGGLGYGTIGSAIPDGPYPYANGTDWHPELALQRYEVLYEAGLVPESPDSREALPPQIVGPWMLHDHRRIVATAMGRLRAKIQYRPVVFELMPPEFTLGQLQACVEAIAGQHVHKQNFRRLVEGAGLVEPTGEMKTRTGGRPAKLFRFRREVLLERPAPGVRVTAPPSRAQ